MSVLTVITRETGAVPLARLGFRVARAVEEKLVVVCVESGEASEPLAVVPGGEIPEGASGVVAEVCRELAGPRREELRGRLEGVPKSERVLADPEVEVRWLRAPHRLPTVLEQIRDAGATFLIAGEHKPREKQVALARELFTAAPCHTLLVRLGEAGDGRPPAGGQTELRPPAGGQTENCELILVPTAGGPHASVALRLAERLASAEGGRVVALYVGSDAGDLAEEVGARILDKAIAEAGVEASRHVERRVALADNRSAAIARVAAEGFDLLLLGDSHAGSLRRRLFGTVPDVLLSGERGLGVAVVRREWKLLHRLRRRLGRWLDLTIPQMARAERVALYEKLQSGSEWNFDFMTLIALSTGIAALGLLQDSGAVVIGAMLVAPLMTPILGAGLALVQGNYPLLRISGRAIAYGYLIALAIGFVLGRLFPIAQLTEQLEARGGPTLLDMGVAFLSGIAAAFCLGRPGLLAALPGVAIAAALVPPIATTGVCLALGEGEGAKGSALLFGTNVVAIILGAAVALYAIGVRGRSGAAEHQRWVRWTFLALLLGAVGLGFPLGRGLKSQLTGGMAVDGLQALEEKLAESLEAMPGARVLGMAGRRENGTRVLEVEISAPRLLPAELTAELAGILREELGADQMVRIETRLVSEIR